MMTENSEFSSKSFFFEFRSCLRYIFQDLLMVDNLEADNPILRRNPSDCFWVMGLK